MIKKDHLSLAVRLPNLMIHLLLFALKSALSEEEEAYSSPVDMINRGHEGGPGKERKRRQIPYLGRNCNLLS